MDTVEGRHDNDVSSLVDRVIDTWSSLYGYKFMGKNQNEFDYISKRKGWEWCVRPFSKEVLMRAVSKVIKPGPYDKTFDWPPTPVDFFNICKGIDPNYANTTRKGEETTNLSNILKKIEEIDTK